MQSFLAKGLVVSILVRHSNHSYMADDLETLWKRLILTEEEDKRIKLGSSSTKVAKEIGKSFMVMKVLT